MVGRGKLLDQRYLGHWDEHRTYPFRSQMAKVELEGVLGSSAQPRSNTHEYPLAEIGFLRVLARLLGA
jgi:hypothetical protein